MNMWPPTHPFRKFCITIAGSKIFAYVVLFVIVLSCVFLAMDQPGVRSDSRLGRAILAFNYIFAAFFVFEIILRAVALGLYDHKVTLLLLFIDTHRNL